MNKTYNIPTRGPIVLSASSGCTVEVWYCRDVRMWCVQTKDVEGNQTGPGLNGTAVFEHSRPMAIQVALESFRSLVNVGPVGIRY